MQIIFSKAAADELSDRYIVLELEEHLVEDKVLETFCVVPSDKVVIGDLVMLDHWKKLHNEFVQANKDKNGKLCHDLAAHLVGKWGGELDEFYQIVANRFEKQPET